MTLDEQQEISVLVSEYAQYAFFDAITLILCFVSYGATFPGAFLLLLIIAVYSLVANGYWGRPQTAMLQGLLAQALVAWEKVTRWRYMATWGSTINLLLCDTIVAWRAYVLFQHAKFWRFTLAILVVSNISVNVADAIWDTINLGPKIAAPSILDWVSILLSLVVNGVATMLFAWKAWSYHQCMPSSTSRKTRRADNILTLLIDSGAIFCAIQAIYLVVLLLFEYNVIRSLQWPLGIADAISIIGSSFNPVAVIVLSQMDNSRLNEECTSGQPQAVTLWSENIYFSTIDMDTDEGAIS
ncbi:hypothetical protein BDP27DRAFT_1336882 [Rhodocollybia butyracea]|uniref:Uncharacterized protein n=1 Tax=Rhodocollybia butyracea TaxID=206335 RepID=A0A9P5U061_9AGAR|nr:hypothetical protein BDP27DRAFT_1336882 [Rhodocollybia butyracea]